MNLPEENKIVKPSKRFIPLTYEIIAWFVWISLIIKLFIFDFDTIILTRLIPQINWAYFRGIPLLVIAAIFIIIFRKNFLLFVLYLLFFPLIESIKFLIMIFKNRRWTFFIIVVSWLERIFSFIKIKFILFAFLVVSTAVILLGHNQILIGISCLYLFIYFMSYLIFTILLATKGSQVIDFQQKIIAWFNSPTLAKAWHQEDSLKDCSVSEMDKTQISTYQSKQVIAVVLNRISYFMINEIEKYKKHYIQYIMLVISLILFIILSLVLFTILNYGLIKAGISTYLDISEPQIGLIFNYTVQSFLGGSNLLFPTNSISQTVDSFMRIISFVLFGVGVFSFILTVANNKNEENVQENLKKMKQNAELIDSQIQTDYKADVQTLVKKFQEEKSEVLLKIIYFFSPELNIKENETIKEVLPK